jgi:hypothetical protein
VMLDARQQPTVRGRIYASFGLPPAMQSIVSFGYLKRLECEFGSESCERIGRRRLG